MPRSSMRSIFSSFCAASMARSRSRSCTSSALLSPSALASARVAGSAVNCSTRRPSGASTKVVRSISGFTPPLPAAMMKKMKMLKRHLSTEHGMTPDEYRARWDLGADYPLVAPNYAETRRKLAKQIGLGKIPGQKRGRRKKAA